MVPISGGSHRSSSDTVHLTSFYELPVLTEISVDNFLGPLSLVSEPTAFIRHTINTWNLTDKAAHFVFNVQDIQYFLNEHGI